MRAIVVLVTLAALTIPAAAQTRLPRTSPAESEVGSINRSLRSETRQLNAAQRNQFETNQLRGEIRRQQSTPTLIGPNSPAAIGGCGPGAVRC
jgi:hypothetical protein